MTMSPVRTPRGELARRGSVVDVPGVVEGEVVRVIEIEPYPQASTALGGCTAFTGRYITDPAEVEALRCRVGGVR